MNNFLIVIDDTTFATGGVDDNVHMDVINDKSQGIGEPARGLIAKNKSGTAQVLYIQITGPDGDKCKKFSIEKGGSIEIQPDMGMEIAELTMWGDTAATIGQVLLFKGR